MNVTRWVVAREIKANGSWSDVAVAVPSDEPLVVGREGDLPLGVDPEDNGISRVALTVSATKNGWRIDVGNRGGARLHPWGLAAGPAQPHQSLDWPLIGVRVLCPTAGHQHWVLLESRLPGDGDPPMLKEAGGMVTSTADPPKSLTPAEVEALWLVFADFLAWPPRVSATPLQLKQASRRLGVSDSAVQVRLNGAVAKARRLGLDRPVRLTDPDYLYVLVGAGYVAPPPVEPVQALLGH